MKSLIKLLVILALLLPALPAGADTFLVMGRAPLGGNEAAAKDAAVTDALSRAVAQAAVGSLDPATLRSNLSLLAQEVLADFKRYITNYSLVASAPSGQDYLALVSVTIDQRALTHSLIRAALKLPTSHLGTILVMVSEETAPGRPPVYWWSGLPGAPDAPAPLVKVLKGMNVRIVNPQPLKALLTPDMRQPVLSEAQALEFARQAGAQVVLIGSIRTYPLVTAKTITPPPLVQLLAINTTSGQVIAIEEAEGPAFHTTPEPGEYPKILAQVEDAVRNLMARLSAKLGESGPASRELTLKVSGVRSLGQLMRLEKTMVAMSDMVDSVQRVSAGAGKATFALTLQGSPSALADQLMVQNYGDFLINVVEQDNRSMEVVIIPRQPGAPGAAQAVPLPAGQAGKDGQQGGAGSAGDRWQTGPKGRGEQKDDATQGGQKQQPKKQLYPWEQGQGSQGGQGGAAQSGDAQQLKQQLNSGNLPDKEVIKQQIKSGNLPSKEVIKQKLKSGSISDLLELKQKLDAATSQGGSGGSGTSGGGGKVTYPWEQGQGQSAPAGSGGASGQ